MSLSAISIARDWLGTPFKDSASVRGVGCDCAGLIEGIARELGIACPDRLSVQSNILAAASAFMDATERTIPGCIVLLSREPGGPPVHAALITDTDTLIHAHWSAGVVENRFGSWFQRRVMHVFAWPSDDDIPLPHLWGSSPEGGEGVTKQLARLLDRAPSVTS
jgi:NlpC/P60 family putative phage cell wall peptidase